MKVMHSEWTDRLHHWIRTLKDDFYEPFGEIAWEAFRTKEHRTPEDVAQCAFTGVEPGFTWGETWEYCWFRGTVTLPAEAAGKRIVMRLAPGGESTLFVNGRSFGTYRADWVSEAHHYMEDNVLTRSGQAGEQYSILMETYAGHYFPEIHSCATGPVLPGAYQDPLQEGKRRTLGVCTYGIWNEDAYQLYMDVDTLYKLLETLDETSLRASKIAEALEEFTLTVDFEQDREGRTASYREAIQKLRPVMEAVNGTTQPVFYATGNAHLDLAWLWPMAETHRKTARTFAAQLRLLEEYPEYKYLQSQPAAYEMCREHYPELFERIKEAIRQGQWIAEGAMWVEPDTNMAGGEALIRQLIHGKRYYREVLGVDSVILWLPDTFGYTAALPQILKGCGVKYLVTQKIFWSYNEGDEFPCHYFTWQGMDGSEIVSFLPTSYTYKTDPKEINTVWKNRRQLRDLDAFLLPYGYGDGGGGPSRDYVEYARRQEDLEGGARVKMAGPLEFFTDMEKAGGPKHTYAGELYFSAHRGTYTSLEKADGLWKTLLLHQFHDILPGSSIARVYVEAREAMEKLLQEAGGIREDALRAILKQSREEEAVTVFNSLSFARKALVTLPDAFDRGACLADGTVLPVEHTFEGLKTLVELPSCGGVSLRPASADQAGRKPADGAAEEAVILRTQDGFILENGQVRAVVNDRGEVTSFVLKESGREFAAKPMNCFHMYKDVPRFFDAWDIDSNYRQQEIAGAFDIEVEELGQGVEAVLLVTGRIGASSYRQYIRLAKESRRLVFETEADWQELHRLLKVSFPVDVHAENGINEMQFGYVERPTHRSKPYDKDRFEVCNHRYSALCDGAHGAAVLNDCKYGISMNGNSLELTLLRAAAGPEMRADNGRHHFTYAFTAWEGTFAGCDVVRQGYEVNVAPLTMCGGRDFSLLSVGQDDIFADTLKPAEDGSGDWILRLYEAKKAARRTCVQLARKDVRAFACDMLENTLQEIPVEDGKIMLDFRAFEVKTVRLVSGRA